ncbi:hypothetical protein BH09MYX1_BH09MYX1_38750 [soil metagenome]
MRRIALLLAALAIPTFVACSKEDPKPVKLAESASSVTAAAPPASAKVIPYAIDPASKTTIDMPAPNEHIKASTSAAAGQLDVDLMNVENTRGEVKIDLLTLSTNTFDDAEKNKSQTDHSHNWLEVGDLVDKATKDANQYAVFAIQSVDGASAKDVSKVAPVKEGADDVRTFTATAHGDFLVHGRKVKKDVPIEVKFHFASGAAADAQPTRIDVRTTSPMKIALAEHDVKPRDNFGKLALKSFNLLGTKVAETADVTLDLHFNAAK